MEVLHLIKICTVCSAGSNWQWVVVQVMAWHLQGAKSLPKQRWPMFLTPYGVTIPGFIKTTCVSNAHNKHPTVYVCLIWLCNCVIKYCPMFCWSISPTVVQTGIACDDHMMTSSNGNFSPVTGLLCGEFTGEFPSQRPVMRSFDVSLDLRLNKRLSKQSWRQLCKMSSRSLWCHCNERWW